MNLKWNARTDAHYYWAEDKNKKRVCKIKLSKNEVYLAEFSNGKQKEFKTLEKALLWCEKCYQKLV